MASLHFLFYALALNVLFFCFSGNRYSINLGQGQKQLEIQTKVALL